ncbi:Uncharacterised protein [Mycobacteroides abscessus subsp. abscessus]|nr:Uncharacterised protein [Mycobacteroides abscessus subsp. abscessus]
MVAQAPNWRPDSAHSTCTAMSSALLRRTSSRLWAACSSAVGLVPSSGSGGRQLRSIGQSQDMRHTVGVGGAYT